MYFQTATYPGTGATNTENYHYSQAVRVGPIIKTSGQGGWDAEGKIESNVTAQIEKAFENALLAAKQLDPNIAWENVYSVKSYHIDMDATFDTVVSTLKRLMPDHKPIWTCVQIVKLGLEGMAIEVEIEAMVTEPGHNGDN